MALSFIDRTRIIMDLLKNGTVTTEANYASTKIDYIDAPTGLKFADAFVSVRYSEHPIYDGNGDLIPAGSLSTAQKAGVVINDLRQYFANILRASRVNEAANTAREAELATVNNEVTTDIGVPE